MEKFHAQQKHNTSLRQGERYWFVPGLEQRHNRIRFYDKPNSLGCASVE